MQQKKSQEAKMLLCRQRHQIGPKGWRPFRYLFMIDKGERLQADISYRELQIQVSNRISAA